MGVTDAVWRKSTRSNGYPGECVEVADNPPGRVYVRDSRDTSGPILTFTPSAWTAFVAMARRTA